MARSLARAFAIFLLLLPAAALAQNAAPVIPLCSGSPCNTAANPGVVSLSGAASGRVGIDQTTPGNTNGVNIDPASASTAGVVPLSSLGVNSLVLKASAGNLWSAYAINRTTTAGFLIVYNATAAPAPGALTANLVLGCVALPASGTGVINNKPGPPQAYTTGISVLISSAANCGTYTTGTITADVFGDAS